MQSQPWRRGGWEESASQGQSHPGDGMEGMRSQGWGASAPENTLESPKKTRELGGSLRV